MGWGSTCRRLRWWHSGQTAGSPASVRPLSSGTVRSGQASTGTQQTVVQEGDPPWLLRLVAGASGRGALRSVTMCCANQRLPRDADSPPWATAAVRKPALGAACPSPWAGAGSALPESPPPTGPGPVLGSGVKLTEEASQTQEKEEGKTELFCDL